MFLPGPNSTGRLLVIETPVPFGPRNCDQSSARAVVNGPKTTTAAISSAFAGVAKVRFFACDVFGRAFEERLADFDTGGRRFMLCMTPVLKREFASGMHSN